MKKTLWIYCVVHGGALGLLGASVDILVWIQTGRPGVLIREGSADIHVATMGVVGAVLGFGFAGIVNAWVHPRGLRKRMVFIVPAVFLVATAVYAVGALLTIKVMSVYPWICSCVAVFAVALVVMRLGVEPKPNNGSGAAPEEKSKVPPMPAAVRRQTKSMIGGGPSTWSIDPLEYDWLSTGQIIRIVGRTCSVKWFVSDGQWHILNGDNGVEVLNLALRDYPFPRQWLGSTNEMTRFLEKVVVLYRGMSFSLATREMYRTLARQASFAIGSEKYENAFRRMFYNPLIKTSGPKWRARFNVLSRRGAVYQWVVSGRHDSKSRRQILREIAIDVVKAETTSLCHPFDD